MEKVNRRTRKTRALLKATLIQLMQKKSVKHITVKELCDIADINRGTFYLHYRDVFDMLEQLENEFFHGLTGIIDEYRLESPGDLQKPLLEDLFTYTLENLSFCRVILSQYGDISFFQKLLAYLHTTLKPIYGYKSEKAEHYYSYIMYGCLGLVVNWINTGAKESPSTMAVLAEDIIMNGISKYLG